MAHFTLHRNFCHRSLTGHVINFVKGEKTWVPPVCHREVQEFGAVPVEPGVESVLGEEAQVVPELTHEERVAQLIPAFRKLQERNHRNDFTGQGIPAVKAVQEFTTFETSKKEIETLWREYIDGGEAQE